MGCRPCRDTTTYRRDGSPATVADASGTRTFAYSADGSPDTITYDTGPLAGYSLDYAQDGLGRPLGYILADGTGTVAEAVYSYDAAGRLATVSPSVAPQAPSFTYGYASGLPHMLATTTANNGTANVLTTTKTYDPLDRLTGISAAPSSALQAPRSAHTYAYNARNQRTRATLADDSYWDYAYDDLGQVTGGVKYNAAATPIPGMAFGYSFDAIGNRTTSTENGHQTDYAANLLNQYTARSVPSLAHVRGTASTDAIVTARPTIAGAPTAPPSQSQRLGETFFVPLPVDNAAAPFVGVAEVTAVLPGAAPGGEDIVATESRDVRIPQATQALTYDLDGNLTSDGLWTYTWNAENRLVAMESASALPAPRSRLTFAYDSQGRRFRKTVYAWDAQTSAFIPQLSSLFLYSGFEQICELRTDHTQSPAVTTTLAHLRGGGQLLSTTATTGQNADTWYFCLDGNKNIVALVDADSATLVARYDYSPFGQLVVAEGPAAETNRFRFSSEVFDPETGLVYYNYRYYSPELGRWLNRDPIEERGGMGLYGYISNSPLLGVDKLGLLLDANSYHPHYIYFLFGPAYEGIDLFPEWSARLSQLQHDLDRFHGTGKYCVKIKQNATLAEVKGLTGSESLNIFRIYLLAHGTLRIRNNYGEQTLTAIEKLYKYYREHADFYLGLPFEEMPAQWWDEEEQVSNEARDLAQRLRRAGVRSYVQTGGDLLTSADQLSPLRHATYILSCWSYFLERSSAGINGPFMITANFPTYAANGVQRTSGFPGFVAEWLEMSGAGNITKAPNSGLIVQKVMNELVISARRGRP